jgi:EAL domain-containing protein (putative c-di-GMP-specific phosphodiesterase class I)
MAEESGLMRALTRYVLKRAMYYLSELNPVARDFSISINVSASILGDFELVRDVADQLAAWGVAARCLTIEVTETSIMNDVEEAMLVMDELKRLGCGLSVDDFGTGYSSLAYLRRMPLDELKIDKVFVRNILEDRGSAQIARSVVDLAHNFGLKAVAEGVETEGVASLLTVLGVDLLQGYHFARPMAWSDFRAWFTERRKAA